MASESWVLHFPQKLVDQPIVYKLAVEYNLQFNILRAYVTPEEEGLLVLELAGEKKDIKKGLDYIKKTGVTVEPLSQDITFYESKCVHCGVCVPLCPTDALTKDESTQKVKFTKEKCIACGICVRACPYKAIKVKF